MVRTIGHSQRCFIVAEAGVNHGGDLKAALALVDAARQSGADCVKFRAYRSELMVGERAPRGALHAGEGGEREWFARHELSAQALAAVKKRCDEMSIEFSASVFDLPSLETVVGLGVSLLKIPSAEITNRALIEACAQTGLPCLLSTGASTAAEISRAIGWHRLAARGKAGRYEFEGGGGVALLHCVSGYPAPASQTNLRAIHRLRLTQHVPVGYSDHSDTCALVPLAVAAGACVVQKALALARDGTPQRAVSALPEEFATMVGRVREVEEALGEGRKRPMPVEQPLLAQTRRLVVAARALRKGETLSAEDLALKRPGAPAQGVIPQDLPRIVGKTLLCDVDADAPLRWEFLAGHVDDEPSWFGTTPPREKPREG